MGTLKSFLYIDNQKMYSLASQLFEGLVDNFIESELKENQDEEQQKGPLGSGNVLVDIMRVQTNKTENKFLHDYLYTKFEDELLKKEKVLIIDNDFTGEVTPYQLIKIRGRIVINDAEKIVKTLQEFNKLGEAIAYLSIYSSKDELFSQAIADLGDIKDRNQKTKAEQKVKNLMKQLPKNYAKENNLHLEEEFIEKLSYSIRYGLEDFLEIQIELNGLTFSSVLNRAFLKEDEKSLVYKLSRMSEKEVSILGIVTQGSMYSISSKNDENDDNIGENFKQIMRTMIDKLIDVENVYTGKAIDEVIVDPIALYLEL